MGGIADQVQPTVVHRLNHEAAQHGDAFFKNGPRLQMEAVIGCQAHLKFVPDAIIRPMRHVVLRVDLEVQARDLR